MEQEKSYHEIRQEFSEKYKKEIARFLDSKDEERIATLKKANLISVITILLAIVGFVATLTIVKEGEIPIQIPILIAVIGCGIRTWYIKKFINEIKKKVMPKACSCFKNLHWSADKYTDTSFIRNSEMFSYYNREHVDDVFYGNYNGINFKIVEICLEYHRRSGKHSSTTTIFDGILLRISMDKKFNGQTVVRPDTLFHSSTASHLKRTELEDVDFEKKFDVFTTDEIEARYLITPALMEKLKNIGKAFYAQRTYCAFNNSEILIGFSNSQNFFEVCSINKPLNDRAHFIKMLNEIIEIYKLIDYLKENLK